MALETQVRQLTIHRHRDHQNWEEKRQLGIQKFGFQIFISFDCLLFDEAHVSRFRGAVFSLVGFNLCSACGRGFNVPFFTSYMFLVVLLFYIHCKFAFYWKGYWIFFISEVCRGVFIAAHRFNFQTEFYSADSRNKSTSTHVHFRIIC